MNKNMPSGKLLDGVFLCPMWVSMWVFMDSENSEKTKALKKLNVFKAFFWSW